MRAVEGSHAHYYGVFAVSSATPGDDGTALSGGAVATGSDGGGGRTAAHEWGHNFGRLDAPCGAQANGDPDYPYSAGAAGVFGYDTQSGTLHPPGTAQPAGLSLSYDIMSRLYSRNWVSDYSYAGAFASLAAPILTGTPIAGLLVWGRVTPAGTVVLEPAFAVSATPLLPTKSGAFELRALDSTGVAMFDLSFDPVADAHGGGGDFSFVIPRGASGSFPVAIQVIQGGVIVAERHAVSPALGNAETVGPAEMSLGRNGTVIGLNWDPNVGAAVMVRDASTGAVLSFARGGSLQLYRLTVSQLELEVSDGRAQLQPSADSPPVKSGPESETRKLA